MLIQPNKKIRSGIIEAYCRQANISGVVCFSCGNASRALMATGLDVIDVSPSGSLLPNKWWSPAEIKKAWPNRFDATSGHLSLLLMLKIANEFKVFYDNVAATKEEFIRVPTGSGETIFCLHLAFPYKKFVAVYNMNDSTKYESKAPLNEIVKQIAYDIEGIR